MRFEPQVVDREKRLSAVKRLRELECHAADLCRAGAPDACRGSRRASSGVGPDEPSR